MKRASLTIVLLSLLFITHATNLRVSRSNTFLRALWLSKTSIVRAATALTDQFTDLEQQLLISELDHTHFTPEGKTCLINLLVLSN